MKKNILRIVSLVIVATMVFAFCSCKQEVLVRFVDKDGNDINIGALTGGSSAGNNDATEAPAGDETQAPAGDETQAPSNDTPATQAPSNDTPATQAPAAETKAPAGNAAPTGKENIFNFYKTAANKIAQNGEAGYTKKEWQTLSNLNLTGSSTVDNAITKLAGNYMTKEADAKDQVSAKGSKEAKDRFPACTLTDLSKVKSATCTVQSNGNYKITIIMVDEDTPKKSGNFLGKVTNSILYWEDIDKELKGISIVKEYDNIHVIYKGYKIEAELTPDGKFVSMKHLGSVDIKIGHAKVLFAPLDNKSGHLDNFCIYSNFKY
ncbi:MAG: hypothetical protein SOX69_06435 [Oscillospiraceae bacterium]|nr:hypothetical protein [Oscillospiraceae bacterium]